MTASAWVIASSNVHSVTGSLMGVNFASKAATDPGQMEFPNIFESYLYDEEDCNVPIKSSLMISDS